MKNYVLDSYAILAYFQNEAGADDVEKLLVEAAAGKAALFMSVINYGEVAYIIQRKAGKEKKYLFLSIMNALPIEITGVDREFALGAADIKAERTISFGDCFALALARHVRGTVVTGDPEFEKIGDLVPIHWLPRKSRSR